MKQYIKHKDIHFTVVYELLEIDNGIPVVMAECHENRRGENFMTKVRYGCSWEYATKKEFDDYQKLRD